MPFPKCLHLLVPFLLVASLGVAYSNNDEKAGITAKISPYNEIFRKSNASTKQIDGKIVPYCLWYNPDQWLLLEKNLNPSAEYSFTLKDGNVFAMILPETNEIYLDNIATIVIEGAKLNGVTNPIIIEQELLLNNGVKVLSLKWSGEIMGVRFVYSYFIYSGKKGTVQTVAYTLEDMYEKNKEAMDLFLQGYCMQNANK